MVGLNDLRASPIWSTGVWSTWSVHALTSSGCKLREGEGEGRGSDQFGKCGVDGGSWGSMKSRDRQMN